MPFKGNLLKTRLENTYMKSIKNEIGKIEKTFMQNLPSKIGTLENTVTEMKETISNGNKAIINKLRTLEDDATLEELLEITQALTSGLDNCTSHLHEDIIMRVSLLQSSMADLLNETRPEVKDCPNEISK